MNIISSLYRASPCLACLLFIFSASAAFAQDTAQKAKLTSEAKLAREHSLAMLGEMERILEEYYYDAKYRGIDLKARIETAKARVKTLQYNWQMYRVLVQLLMDFNDSHTSMILPPRSDYFQYGFGTQMIGSDCFVTSVKKDGDAKKQGLEVGDQILSLGRFKPNRRDFWKMKYVLYKLDPMNTIDLNVRKPAGTEQALKIAARTMTEKEFRAEQKARKDKKQFEPFKCQQISGEVIACKLYTFITEKSDIDKMMKQAAKYPKLILDLRGNGGGFVSIEEYLLSYFFTNEIKIADSVSRKKTETTYTKPLSGKHYKGEVIVLIDGDSASAAEMTARVLQIEKRAKVFGDTSSGKVMTSIAVPFRSMMSSLVEADLIRAFMSVTVADLIMSDGSRLEDSGVVPDRILQPSGIGLKMKTDPVLAIAANEFGSNLAPEKAGSYYFMAEKDEDGADYGNSGK